MLVAQESKTIVCRTFAATRAARDTGLRLLAWMGLVQDASGAADRADELAVLRSRAWILARGDMMARRFM